MHDITTDSRPRKRSVRAVLSVTALALVGGACAFLSTGGSAAAAGTADLSVSQKISGSLTSGQTVDTVSIHNAGPNTALNVNMDSLLKDPGSAWGVGASAGTCQILPSPTGYLGHLSCQFASIASGATLTETLTWSGTAGDAFTVFTGVGLGSPADPSFANNSSSVSSYFGPRSDLALTEVAKPGSTTGKASIVSTITNKGPNTAQALQTIIEINSPTSTGANYSATPLSSCQFIPPAAGFTAAVSCTTDSLATGAKWVITATYSGTHAASLMTSTKVTANTPADPVTTNNSHTASTTYK